MGFFDFRSDTFSELFSTFNEKQAKLGSSTTPATSDLRSWRSKSDDTGMTLEVDLPGISPKDVTLWAVDNQLTVMGKGERKFTNRYTIDVEYDVLTATASMKNGQLRVRLERAPAKDAKRIPIVIE